MITNTISTDQTSQYTIDHSNQKWVLKDGVSITSMTNGMSEGSNLANNVIEVAGTITANEYNRAAVYSAGDNTTVTIAQSGELNGYFGVKVDGDNSNVTNNGTVNSLQDGLYGSLGSASIVNNGQILSDGSGIKVASGDYTIRNTGDISGYYGLRVEHANVTATLEKGGHVDASVQAIRVMSLDGDVASVTNNGMVSVSKGYEAFYGQSGSERFVNTGTVLGHVKMGEGNDRYINHGTMAEGDVNMGGDNDVYNGRGATFGGKIYGGTGNDTFIVSKANAQIMEYFGQGNDTVKSTVSFVLQDGQAIEDLRLLGKGNTNATGNEFMNNLFGNAGANKLVGGEGDDTLSGGKGADLLSGGANNDIFVFRTGFGKDTVTDFTSGEDRIDLSGVKGISNYNDLMSHHITVSGDDLVIREGHDMLVLRDTQRADLNMTDFIF